MLQGTSASHPRNNHGYRLRTKWFEHLSLDAFWDMLMFATIDFAVGAIATK